MATIKYKDENGWQEIAVGGGESVEVVDSLDSEDTTAALSANQGRVLKEMIEELPSGGGAAGETKIYEVYASPQNDDELSANIKVYNAVMNGENAIYRTYSEMGWLTATLAFSVSSLVSLTFEVSQNASDGSGLTTTQISMALNSSGSLIVSPESPISIPSTSKVEEMIAQSGGEGGAESPYAMKVFIVPEGVMTATQDAPYTFTPEEAEEFLAQGDFKRTMVKYPTQVLIGMGALNIANLCLYIESDSVQGFICEGTEVTEVSVGANGEMDSAIEYIKTTINCANTPNAIMGYCSISKYYATPK